MKHFVFIGLCFIKACGSQDQYDSTPFERPAYLVSVRTDSTRIVFQKILNIVQNFGFVTSKSDSIEGIIEASRKTKDERDKIIIWLERDFSEPMSNVKVYFLFGRFIGNESNMQRLKVDLIEEERHVGKMKLTLLGLSTQKPN